MKKIIKKTYKNWGIVLLLFVSSILFITICSKNSPLYIFNDWVDGNAFFTMGKGIMNGMVPYKDLFEQKGPILYFIYGVGYLISNTNLFGIYILEIISFTIFLFYCMKIINIVLEKKYALFIAILTGAIITSSIPFVQGGSAEEFCLPLLAISFYHFLIYIDKKTYDRKILFINGFIAGIVSLIKFNLLGFWFIWMALVFFKHFLKKEYKVAFKSCVPFLLGMGTPILLFVIYFIITGSLKDFYEAYIKFNIGSYTTDVSKWQRIKDTINNIKGQMMLDMKIFHLTIFGFIGVTFSKNFFKNIYQKVFIIASFIFLSIGIYIGGIPYIYYYLLDTFYIIFGITFIVYFINNRFALKHIKYVSIVILLLFFTYKSLLKSNNIASMNLQKEDFAQFTFNEIMKKNKGAFTLLNYDNLDGGFYTVSNVLPSTKYFMRQNISYDRYPNIMDAQNKIIKDSEVDYVIVREYFDNEGYHNDIDALNENYNLISQKKQLYEGMSFEYFLYEKKEK